MYTDLASIEDRYQAVRNLIIKGATEGERNAAKLAAKRMEATNPHLQKPRYLGSILVELDFEQDLRASSRCVHTYVYQIKHWQIIAHVSVDGWHWDMEIKPHVPNQTHFNGHYGFSLSVAAKRAKSTIMHYAEKI
jgi:hypothetical protein